MEKRRDGGDDGTWDPDCAAAAAAAIVEICGCCCPIVQVAVVLVVLVVSGVPGLAWSAVAAPTVAAPLGWRPIGVQSGVIGGTWNVRLNERVVYVYVCGGCA